MATADAFVAILILYVHITKNAQSLPSRRRGFFAIRAKKSLRVLQIPKKFRPYLTRVYEFHSRNFGLIFSKTRNFSGNTEGLMCPKQVKKTDNR
jgi:hypothetical protein